MFTVDWDRALPPGLHVDVIDNLNNSEKLCLWSMKILSWIMSAQYTTVWYDEKDQKTQKQSLNLWTKNDLRLLWIVTNVIGSVRMT